LWSREEDPVNLRCLRPRERFGRDWLLPIERYTEALTAPTIVTRSGERRPNPLFAHGRTPDMVSVVLISGVPWQDLVTPESLQRRDVMQLLTPEGLEARGAWTKILGDPSRNVTPTDPHLLQSVAPRPGLASPGDAWDPVHGHEVTPPKADDL